MLLIELSGAIVQSRQTGLDVAISSTFDASYMANPREINGGSFRGTWRATVSSKRKHGVTKEEFSRRLARHGRTLAGPLAVKYDCISYVQVCTPTNHVAIETDWHGQRISIIFQLPTQKRSRTNLIQYLTLIFHSQI